jgi:hypothetical protein
MRTAESKIISKRAVHRAFTRKVELCLQDIRCYQTVRQEIPGSVVQYKRPSKSKECAMTKMTKTLTALAAIATIGVAAVAAPQPAQARGGALAAGIIGGLAAGAIIGSAAQGPYYGYGPGYYYGPGPVYYRGGPCYWTHRPILGRLGLARAASASLRLIPKLRNHDS